MTSPATVGNIPGIRYGYQVAPWDAPLSLGSHALIEYNGLVMNDRYQADRIHVTQVTGLDDADVYDARDAKPGGHGETPYDSWYRGRTIVMTGRVEAGSLGTYTAMRRDLKAAFAPLVEAPMKFRWFDVYDSFDDPGALAAYTLTSGSSSGLTPSQGVLMLPATPFSLLRSADARLWGDSQQTIRIVAGAQDTSNVFLIPKYKDSNNYVQCFYSANTSGAPAISIYVVIAGTQHALASTAVGTVQVGQSIWLRARIEGDLVTVELWTAPPQDDSVPAYSRSAWLTGSDADLLGDLVLSQVGLGASVNSAVWALDDYRIESLYPGDVVFNAKKLSAIQMSDVPQTSNGRFLCPFQITMRASRHLVLGATQSRSLTLVPSQATSPTLGFNFPLMFPLRFTRYTTSQALLSNNILSVNNRGTTPVKGKVVVYGSFTSILVQNLVNGQVMRWSSAQPIADGDHLVFDCHAETVVNSSGANMMGSFDATTDWLQLEPGWNDLYFGGSGYSGNTMALVFSRNGWM